LDEILGFAPDHPADIVLKFGFRNFGRTPGVITEITADLCFSDKVPKTPKHRYVGNPSLGMNEGNSEDIVVTLKVTPGEAAMIRLNRDGARQIALVGMIRFEDVFGESETELIQWVFDNNAGQMLPVLYPRVVRKQRKH
jgi:hypothetical protein